LQSDLLLEGEVKGFDLEIGRVHRAPILVLPVLRTSKIDYIPNTMANFCIPTHSQQISILLSQPPTPLVPVPIPPLFHEPSSLSA